ncbi:MAG: bifunctional diaminohydroxyphosphoribosylaminopyrimidine deaminase/5-amino-6-(5-phosphoribosylamino)uracil reductase RibD [Candidatus Omnitrophica bacterium]|nr:bifunctional diaminohydroxyphosphoribosylaminopyrimidine deaminase/5-amino-6-(5-phosphoribosylamino)uracil reductase RibD [Candidatus Omnitrophota bacterium]
MNIDEKYMRVALDLAKKGKGFTSPNPMVGAVIVKNGRIVGKGYHKRCGSAHAEVNALKNAAKFAKGATIYVSLEPCGHFGRTPPCTDALVESGIKRTVIAMKDPNPANNGRGIKKLVKSGIRVKVGILKEEAARLNKPYIKFITKKMPYVTVKIAESLDGKIATRTGESRWITGDDSRRFVHDLRARSDAVMVGVNTVIKDDPLLLSRTSKGRQPIRIIVDSHFRTPKNARIFSEVKRSPVIVATTKKNGPDPFSRVDLKALLKVLAKREIANILVEGGGELVASLVENRLVDKFLFFIAPKIIGGRLAKTAVEGTGVDRISRAIPLKFVKIKRFKEDILIEAEVN